MNQPDLAIIYESHYPKDLFDEFNSTLSRENLNIAIEGREPSGLMAGVTWYLFTGIVVYISKLYFEGF